MEVENVGALWGWLSYMESRCPCWRGNKRVNCVFFKRLIAIKQEYPHIRRDLFGFPGFYRRRSAYNFESYKSYYL